MFSIFTFPPWKCDSRKVYSSISPALQLWKYLIRCKLDKNNSLEHFESINNFYLGEIARILLFDGDLKPRNCFHLRNSLLSTLSCSLVFCHVDCICVFENHGTTWINVISLWKAPPIYYTNARNSFILQKARDFILFMSISVSVFGCLFKLFLPSTVVGHQ